MNLGYFVRGQRIRKSLIEFQFAIDPIFSGVSLNKKSKGRRFTISKKSCGMRIESLVPRFHDVDHCHPCHVHFSPCKLYRTSKSVSSPLHFPIYQPLWDERLERYFDDGKTFEFSDGSMILFASIYLAHILPARLLLLFRRDKPHVGLVEDHHFWGGISGNSGPRGEDELEFGWLIQKFGRCWACFLTKHRVPFAKINWNRHQGGFN